MTLTLQHIADIVADTIEHTVKEMEQVTDAIRLIAKVAATVQHTLDADSDVEIDPQRSRSLREDALVWTAVTKIKDHA